MRTLSSLPPNLAFTLIIFGLLLLYCEFIWVGKIIFGLCGSILALIGLATLCRLPHTILGLCLLAAALPAFLIEAICNTCFLAGLLASLLMACGFWKLLSQQPISPWVAFPLSLLLGVVTTWLLAIAKQARRNKRIH